jgi:DinB superfamily
MTPEERAKLIDRYADGPAVLRRALDATPDEMRKWRPAEGEFSVHEVVVHCADSETNSHGRIRYVLAEDNPTIIGYDPGHWAEAFDYQNHPLEAAMLTVEAVRANTVPILRNLPEGAWAKAGTHTESGPYSAEDWLRIYAAHCHEHAEQIEAVVAAWRHR